MLQLSPACAPKLRCRYGARPRNILDVYLPPSVQSRGAALQQAADDGDPASRAADAGSSGEGAPVVLFCHGGVWASGAKWHYAPLATRLAQAGVITAVMQVGGHGRIKHTRQRPPLRFVHSTKCRAELSCTDDPPFRAGLLPACSTPSSQTLSCHRWWKR